MLVEPEPLCNAAPTLIHNLDKNAIKNLEPFYRPVILFTWKNKRGQANLKMSS
jgi:hypothetical protein